MGQKFNPGIIGRFQSLVGYAVNKDPNLRLTFNRNGIKNKDHMHNFGVFFEVEYRVIEAPNACRSKSQKEPFKSPGK